MHILGQLETPPPQKNAPPPLLDIPGYALPRAHNSFTTLLLLT